MRLFARVHQPFDGRRYASLVAPSPPPSRALRPPPPPTPTPRRAIPYKARPPPILTPPLRSLVYYLHLQLYSSRTPLSNLMPIPRRLPHSPRFGRNQRVTAAQVIVSSAPRLPVTMPAHCLHRSCGDLRLHPATYVYASACGELDLRPATVRLHAVDTVYPSAT
ncbi:hypothetical protein DFH09DRAFT_1444834 [Mycena vulgaris]|nr:hypothetical protein DFH09DRAFT_1444834 [Mycena vulgaris]